MSDRSARSRLLPLLLAALAALTGTAAAAPQRVDNPAAPAEGLVTARMVEAWRAGGEDDDIFFGNIARVHADAAGDVLAMDRQLCEVHVYAPDGTHLRTLAGEGDGPGEIRNPNDFFVAPDGAVCLLPGFGGRLVKVAADGTPAGEAAFSTDEGPVQFVVPIRGLAAEGGMLLAGIRMSFAGGVSQQTYFLSLCDDEATQRTVLLEKENPVDYADFVMSEKGMDFVWSRMAVAPDGRVLAVPERNAYAVHVWSPAGDEQLVIARDYEPFPREARGKDVQRKILEGIGRNYPRPPHAYEVEDTEPDVTGLWMLADGTLWVQTSRGDGEPPAGAWTVLDVFDPDGRFVRQVALAGDHDAAQDALHLLPDGRAVVVTGALDAYLNAQGTGETGDQDVETTHELICYRLEM